MSQVSEIGDITITRKLDFDDQLSSYGGAFSVSKSVLRDEKTNNSNPPMQFPRSVDIINEVEECKSYLDEIVEEYTLINDFDKEDGAPPSEKQYSSFQRRLKDLCCEFIELKSKEELWKMIMDDENYSLSSLNEFESKLRELKKELKFLKNEALELTNETKNAAKKFAIELDNFDLEKNKISMKFDDTIRKINKVKEMEKNVIDSENNSTLQNENSSDNEDEETELLKLIKEENNLKKDIESANKKLESIHAQNEIIEENYNKLKSEILEKENLEKVFNVASNEVQKKQLELKLMDIFGEVSLVNFENNEIFLDIFVKNLKSESIPVKLSFHFDSNRKIEKGRVLDQNIPIDDIIQHVNLVFDKSKAMVYIFSYIKNRIIHSFHRIEFLNQIMKEVRCQLAMLTWKKLVATWPNGAEAVIEVSEQFPDSKLPVVLLSLDLALPKHQPPQKSNQINRLISEVNNMPVELRTSLLDILIKIESTLTSLAYARNF